jgi:hypothetical protein
MMASAIKNVSMTYVPRDNLIVENDCAYSSRRGCSKLLTIDNKCRGPVRGFQLSPALRTFQQIEKAAGRYGASPGGPLRSLGQRGKKPGVLQLYKLNFTPGA